MLSLPRRQAYVYWNSRRRQACVAFRGTEQGAWRDILTDLHLVPAPLDPERVAAAQGTAGEGRLQAGAGWRHTACLHAVLTFPGRNCVFFFFHVGGAPERQACPPPAPARAALAEVSQPPEEPGRLRRIL